ncbi:MAG: hypothetical protein Q8O51_02880 [bacterium]|nr:hypothetical protein [bacterium]
MTFYIPQGIEAILAGAVMVAFSTRAPKGRRRTKRHRLGLIGLLIEVLFFWGGLSLVLYGVVRS